MSSKRLILFSLCAAASIFLSQASFANLPACNTAPTGQPCHFTNVADFEGGYFDHVSFDPVDERTPDSIRQKFENISSFSITGGSGAIRHTSEYAAVFAGEDTAGGAVSGEYRIDMGYYGITEVAITFSTPVDSAGGFFGGSSSLAILTVFLEDGTSYEITREEAGLPIVPGETPSLHPECTAINGFLGVDSEDGAKIVKAIFLTASDASSLDSLFFGSAQGGSQGAGVVAFPETLVNPNCTALGYKNPPLLPKSAVPVVDSDDDGMPDDWEQLYGLNPFDPSDAPIDSDGDGFSNLTEFNNDTDPTYFDSNTPNTLVGNTEIQGALRLTPQSTPPVNCTADSEGSIYYDSLMRVLLICDGVGWKEYRGPQGETGPAGESGEKGIQGDRGIDGKQGVKGEKGDKGESGKDAPFASIQCSSHQIIRYNGTEWECAADVLGALTLDCQDGDTIMLKNGAWQCAHLPGQGIGKSKGKTDDKSRNHRHEKKNKRRGYNKNHHKHDD